MLSKPVHLGLLRGLVAAILLTGCASAPFAPPVATQAPPATAVVIRVAHTPALRSRLPALQTCAAEIPGMGLAVNELPAPSLRESGADLQLRLGPEEDRPGPVVELAYLPLRVVVHPDNPLRLLSVDELASIFSGAVPEWDLPGQGQPTVVPSAGQSIHVWTYLPGDDVRVAVESALAFSGSTSLPQRQAPDPLALREAVAADPQAIGILPLDWLDGSVAAVDLSGLPEGGLRVPILAYSETEPSGLLRQLLGCLTE